LIDGRDDLAEWAKQRRDADWFLEVDDEDTQSSFSAVVQAVADGGFKVRQPRNFWRKLILS
jgi:hypothetical protein